MHLCCILCPHSRREKYSSSTFMSMHMSGPAAAMSRRRTMCCISTLSLDNTHIAMLVCHTWLHFSFGGHGTIIPRPPNNHSMTTEHSIIRYFFGKTLALFVQKSYLCSVKPIRRSHKWPSDSQLQSGQPRPPRKARFVCSHVWRSDRPSMPLTFSAAVSV